MRKLIYLLPILFLLCCNASAQKNDEVEKEIKKVLEKYVDTGDENNADQLLQCLSPDFRVVLFDKDKQATSVLNKDTYVSFIRDKKIGGYPRTEEYHNIAVINDMMATVQVTLTSPGKPTLKNFYSMVKVNGKWLVVQDYVILIK